MSIVELVTGLPCVLVSPWYFIVSLGAFASVDLILTRQMCRWRAGGFFVYFTGANFTVRHLTIVFIYHASNLGPVLLIEVIVIIFYYLSLLSGLRLHMLVGEQIFDCFN